MIRQNFQSIENSLGKSCHKNSGNHMFTHRNNQERIKPCSVMHQNVQSIGNCVDRLNVMLQENPECDILCISEHWKNAEQLQRFALENFRLASYFCREEGYGGAAIYVRKHINTRNRKKLEALSIKGVFECACIECDLQGEQFVFVAVYRPPKSEVKEFFQQMENLLGQMVSENKRVFVAGYFNIELFENNNIKVDFLSIMNSFQVLQTIFENTRITPTSKSCIDNIFCNISECNRKSSVLKTFISDHTAQKVTFNCKETSKFKPYYQRYFSQENKNAFVNVLKQEDWKIVYSVNKSNVNKQWSVFMNCFIPIFNQCFPKKLVTKNRKNSNLYRNVEEIMHMKNRLNLVLTLNNLDAQYTEM